MATASASTLVAMTKRMRLVGIGQQAGAVELAFETVAVLGFAMAGFERAEAAQFAFDRGADHMGEARHFRGDPDIVVVAAGRLAVFLERAVHHHRGEAVLDRRQAGRDALAMVLMDAQRNLGIHQLQGFHHLGEHDVAGIGAGAAARLDDDRGVDGAGGLHDGERLLHVVDVEGGHAVAAFGGAIQQLSKRDPGHAVHSFASRVLAAATTASAVMPKCL